MANNLIPQELDTLIQEYLTDGVLTDKERQVILRKAEGMGLDRDEIDLYLDAQVQKIDQATDAAARKQKGKQCPYCGGSIPMLADKCPHCGENITPAASEELQEIFDNLEEALVDFKAGKDFSRSKATVERYMRKAKMYYGNNPKIQKLLEEVETESFKVEKKAANESRRRIGIKVLTNKWLYLLFCVLFIVFSCNMCSSYNSEAWKWSEKSDSLRNELDKQYYGEKGLMIESGWEEKVSLDSLKQKHPEAYYDYHEKDLAISNEHDRVNRKSTQWMFTSFAMIIITIIYFIICIRLTFSKKN